MKLLIVDTSYPAFLQQWYQAHPDLAQQPYREQRQRLLSACFGTSDFYSSNLNTLGHAAEEVIVNCVPLQRQWTREHAPSLATIQPAFSLKRLDRLWQHWVLKTQIAHIRPDVLYIQDMNWVDATLLHEVREYVRLVVGQIACPLQRKLRRGTYDLVLTSLPHVVQRFRQLGQPSEYFRLGFEPKILSRIGALERRYSAVFVGGYAAEHEAGTRLFEAVARQVSVDFWGYGVDALSPRSAIRTRFHGTAWGLEMYKVLGQARLVLNRHSAAAENFANNMRLYEATGMGALLLTDHKVNLSDLFEPGREVITYQNAAECIDRIGYYLDREAERAAIAAAGQARTLREHTYAHRMAELSEKLLQRLP